MTKYDVVLGLLSYECWPRKIHKYVLDLYLDHYGISYV